MVVGVRYVGDETAQFNQLYHNIHSAAIVFGIFLFALAIGIYRLSEYRREQILKEIPNEYLHLQ